MDKAYWYSVGRQAWQEFRLLAKRGVNWLLATPLPRVFMLCVVIALVCVLLPLTIMLFLGFVVLKVAFSLLAYANLRRRASSRPYGDVHFQRQHKG